jgi:hypothetical protein
MAQLGQRFMGVNIAVIDHISTIQGMSCCCSRQNIVRLDCGALLGLLRMVAGVVVRCMYQCPAFAALRGALPLF